MKYGVLFALIGLFQILLAFQSGWWGILWVWSGLSFLIVSLGYLRFGPTVLGKRANGTLPGWRVALLFPYLVLTWSLWHCQRLISHEDCCNEVAPGIWVGRRPFPQDLPNGTELVVDLTAEFTAAKGIVEKSEYVCMPTLDTSLPDDDQLLRLIRLITEINGPVYIHCASGHGRSSAVAAALLMFRGDATDVAEAEQMLKRSRRGIGFSSWQLRRLSKWNHTGATVQR